ncbi:MAG TPA: Ig-like domain-containing protein, partial [Rhizobiaceae bacterium]|nr:Ig-like domain-containing protein [Rhizobiaceae bacterium]
MAAPDTVITTNTPAITNSTSVMFDVTSFDDGYVQRLEYRLDDAAYWTHVGSYEFTSHIGGLSEGTHTFAVRAVDNLGEVDPTPATFTWTIDTTPPTAPVVVTAANGAITNNPMPPIIGTGEPGATITIYFDGVDCGSTTADGSGNWFFTPAVPLTGGSHTVTARATDAAGNTSADSNTNTFTVDMAEPDTSITMAPPSPMKGLWTATFHFTGNGTGSTIARYEASLDGEPFETVSSGPLHLSGLAEGSHTLKIRAVDAAGNTDTTPAQYTWIVDSTAPDTTIGSTPATLSNSGNASFTFSGTDFGDNPRPITSYQHRLDGGAWSSPSGDTWAMFSGLSDGEHTFEVRAIDDVANTDVTPASFTWTVDTQVQASFDTPAPVVEDTTGQSVATLTLDADAEIDITSLAAHGWTGDVTSGFVKTLPYGTATLSITEGTVTFVLNESAADTLKTGDTVTETLIVPVIDEAGNTLNAEVEFTIEGANDAPSNLTLAGTSVKEFRANGTIVGTLSAMDAEDADTPLTFELVNNAGGRFALSGGKIVVANGLLLDYEQAKNHVVQVKVTDTDGLTQVKNFTINLTNVDPEIVTGNAAANIIVGGVKNDTLSGLGGNDRLAGGAGRDKLTGGTGADDFIFTAPTHTGKTAATRDVI